MSRGVNAAAVQGNRQVDGCLPRLMSHITPLICIIEFGVVTNMTEGHLVPRRSLINDFMR